MVTLAEGGSTEGSGVGPVDAIAALLAFGVPAAAVLRDLAPPKPPRPPRSPRSPKPAKVAKVAAPARAAKPVAERVPERAPYLSDGSMLSGLTTTEDDERSALRRVGAFAVLITLTLLTAAGVYAVIYRTVSGLG